MSMAVRRPDLDSIACSSTVSLDGNLIDARSSSSTSVEGLPLLYNSEVERKSKSEVANWPLGSPKTDHVNTSIRDR